MISLQNVSMKYSNGTIALDNIDLEIEKGEFVFIVGNSGSGKTTLIKLLMGELRQTSGDIKVNGRNIKRLKRRHLYKVRRDMGIVFQDFQLLDHLTIYENVAFAQKVIEMPHHKIRRNVPIALNLVGLGKKSDSYPNQLSGGEQQRAAVARAIVNAPHIVLADEPTGNLDPKNSWEIMKLLEDINKRGTTVIVVTHNKSIVDLMKKRVIQIKDGIIVRDEKRSDYGDAD